MGNYRWDTGVTGAQLPKSYLSMRVPTTGGLFAPEDRRSSDVACLLHGQVLPIHTVYLQGKVLAIIVCTPHAMVTATRSRF